MPETCFTVKDKLCSVRKYDLAANEAEQNYETLRSAAVRITPTYGGVRVNGSAQRSDFSGSLDRLGEAARTVNQMVDRYVDALDEVSGIISEMDNPDEMKCLRLRYLSYRSNPGWRLTSWDEVAEQMCVSRRQATNIHGRALQHFEQIWKSRPEA